MSEMRLMVAGAGGRMGRTLVKAIADNMSCKLTGALEDARSPLLGWDAGTLAGLGENHVKLTGDPLKIMGEVDGIIDFTIPPATVGYAALAAKAGKVHIIGTTGLSIDDESKIKAAAKTAVIVKSGNMSLGVNLLAALTRRVAKTLDSSFDIEILEMHHNQKVDAPSGTALLLGRAAAEGRGIDLDRNSVRSRDGNTGARHAGGDRSARGRYRVAWRGRGRGSRGSIFTSRSRRRVGASGGGARPPRKRRPIRSYQQPASWRRQHLS